MLQLHLTRPVIRGKAKSNGDLPVCFEVIQCLAAGRERHTKADALAVFRDPWTPSACDLRDEARIARTYDDRDGALDEGLQFVADRRRMPIRHTPIQAIARRPIVARRFSKYLGIL